ncbi:MAG: transcriptional repressor [Lachnospiraceae bacterium]|nr:transcriptional repressor [Lachnospiraceae bacterium]
MIKHSRQREAIQCNLSQRYDHPTAETIYMDIKKEFPNISLGTVYRNLTLLSDLGKIQKISTGVGPDRFDGNPKPHTHFQCRNCNCVLDIQLENTDSLNTNAAKNFSGIIEESYIQFFGLCENCI